ncbi:NADH dehydrogenase [ubiquinone] 1 alpha subcomplex subunit [Paragonimus heterotremus]|uniref:NADH dehydrogenase [ubiquinone] 1 alpha subcomplex subunit 12 n=1 Tax=Paragonimus heterotremus TaxID=100268 RepID=A0A8J4STB1_9TREM|nr:NADH dehydrogenase [ubiquinone] 1 alpha subcomplex subunit [Paragonimus heterotremus]
MSSLLEKLSTLRTIIRQNGGILGSVKCRTDELKWGTHVGTDKFGNKYYENNKYFMGRNRHRWLHHMTDETPIDRPPEVRKWTAEHSENTTLDMNKKYVPYSTTRPKIEAWKPT